MDILRYICRRGNPIVAIPLKHATTSDHLRQTFDESGIQVLGLTFCLRWSGVVVFKSPRWSIKLPRLGFPPCLLSLQTPIIREAKKGGGDPPFVDILMDGCLEAGWARRKSHHGN